MKHYEKNLVESLEIALQKVHTNSEHPFYDKYWELELHESCTVRVEPDSVWVTGDNGTHELTQDEILILLTWR